VTSYRGQRLRLDKETGIVAGVCAGFAHWLGVDPTWVRVAALVIALCATKAAIVAYLIAWLILDD
jgi:phage shock protein C